MRVKKNYRQQGVWRYWGATLEQSAAVRYQLRFRQDVINLALVHIFNFKKNIGLQLSADVFQISQQRQALFVKCQAFGPQTFDAVLAFCIFSFMLLSFYD